MKYAVINTDNRVISVQTTFDEEAILVSGREDVSPSEVLGAVYDATSDAFIFDEQYHKNLEMRRNKKPVLKGFGSGIEEEAEEDANNVVEEANSAVDSANT